MGIQFIKSHSLSNYIIVRNQLHETFSHNLLWFVTKRAKTFLRLKSNILNIEHTDVSLVLMFKKMSMPTKTEKSKGFGHFRRTKIKQTDSFLTFAILQRTI